MSEKYKFVDPEGIYFVTPTIVHWIDLFTRASYKDLICSSLRYCIEEKGLVLHAWCIMSSHLHLIISTKTPANPSDIMRDFKKFTSKEIVKLIGNQNESRREWLLRAFMESAQKIKRNRTYKVWRDGNHPILLDSVVVLQQRLDNVHNNPVDALIVSEASHYIYSSAIDYSGGKGLLPIKHLT
jgi:REP element-mobilizing transposase RayT